MPVKLTTEMVMEALSRVIDEESGRSIVESGMVSGLQVKDSQVIFALNVDPAKGGALEPLRQKAEKAVLAMDRVKRVNAVLTAERPQGRKPALYENLAPSVKNIIAVASGKGGVGKSTVAVNLAVALAQSGLKTGLMDADIYGPSVPMMMGVQGVKPDISDNKVTPLEAHGVKFISIGSMVDDETPMIWRGPMIQTALRQFLQDVDWGDLDVLVVDMPPGTGDAQLTMAQKVPLAGAVIVSTPQDIALLDARKAVTMFQKVSVPVLGIVENMSSYICPRCEHEEHIFGEQGAKREAEKLGCAFLGEIPLTLENRLCGDEGTPVVTGKPDSETAKAFVKIATHISEVLQDKAGAALAG